MLTPFFIAGGVALASFLFGTGGVDPYQEVLDAWEKGIHKSVDDDTREEEAQKVIEEARVVLKDARLKQGDAMKALFAADKKYNATLEDYDSVISQLSDIWISQDNKLLEQRFQIKAILTGEEFLAVTAIVKKKMAKVKEDVDDEIEDGQEDHDDQLEDLAEEEEDAKEDAEKEAKKKAKKEAKEEE